MGTKYPENWSLLKDFKNEDWLYVQTLVSGGFNSGIRRKIRKSIENTGIDLTTHYRMHGTFSNLVDIPGIGNSIRTNLNTGARMKTLIEMALVTKKDRERRKRNQY